MGLWLSRLTRGSTSVWTYPSGWGYRIHQNSLSLVELLSRLTTKLTAMSDQKPPFIFNNYPLHLFTLTAASPLINLCPMQKMPSDDIRCFYVLFFSACPHLHACLHLTWKYVTICNISSLRAAMFFCQKNISCTRNICTDIYTEGSSDFHPNFHYKTFICWTDRSKIKQK